VAGAAAVWTTMQNELEPFELAAGTPLPAAERYLPGKLYALFAGQYDWSSQATSNPRKIIDGYAAQIGLDMAAYGQCFDTQKHVARIQANAKAGTERGVGSTPTLIINNKMYPGGLPFDQIKKLVDSLTAAAPAAAAAPATQP
jgi:protein-disulfide isomerase